MTSEGEMAALNDDILIVDDEIPNLHLLAELLEKEGYRVRPAEMPQMAIDSALAKPPSLILLDVRMPEIDGFEVCRRLKAAAVRQRARRGLFVARLGPRALPAGRRLRAAAENTSLG